MENIVVYGVLTNTSNKVSEEYKSEVPTKCAYLYAASKEDADKMVSFGLTEYTPKDGGSGFFAVRMSKTVSIYHSDNEDGIPDEKIDCRVTDNNGNKTPNFKCRDGVTVAMNLVKGEKMKNSFIRLQAFLCDDFDSVFEEIKPLNPFI